MRPADVAQEVEQLTCNQQVVGSTPTIGSSVWVRARAAERYPSGQREQTVNLPASAYRGSSPLPSTKFAAVTDGTETETDTKPAGVAQLVERQPSKLNVAGSSPVSRSLNRRPPR